MNHQWPWLWLIACTAFCLWRYWSVLQLLNRALDQRDKAIAAAQEAQKLCGAAIRSEKHLQRIANDTLTREEYWHNQAIHWQRRCLEKAKL